MDGMSVASGATYRSVGNVLATSRVLSPGAPAYNSLTQQLVEQVKREVAKEAEKRRGAIPVLLPYAMDPVTMGEVVAMYPEYRIIPLNSTSVVHADWQAHRHMAVHLGLDMVLQYTSDIVIVGDALYQCATRNLRSVHIEGDASDPFGQHSRHASTAEYLKVAKSATLIEQQHGYELSSVMHRDFVRGSCLQVCVEADSCKRRAAGMVFDLGMTSMSLTQACAAMAQAGAHVAVAFMPYTPDVFRVPEGKFVEGCGVEYRVDAGSFRVLYPQGVAGVSTYPLGLWAEWLNSSTVVVTDSSGEDISYRLELTQHRGPFMYARIVRLDGAHVGGVTTHALELPWAEGKYVLSYSRLKGLASDPVSPSSWEQVAEILPQDVCDKLYLHAMSLGQAEFSPENLLQRVSKIDSRIITSGVNVRIREPLKLELAVDVAANVFSKAFVARYEMGRLGSDLVQSLAEVVGFSTASRARKAALVLMGAATCLWGHTVGSWVDSFKSFLVGWMRNSKGAFVLPEFVQAPRFLLLSEYNTWYARVMRGVLGNMYGGSVSLPSVRGARLAVMSRHSSARHAVVSHDIRPHTLPNTVAATGVLHDEIVDTSVGRGGSSDVEQLVSALAVNNDVTRNAEGRMELAMMYRTPRVPQGHSGPERYTVCPDPAVVMSEVGERLFPGSAVQNFEMDAVSMRYDPQVRDWHAEYLEHPIDDPVRSTRQEVYKSRIKNYHVERKGQTLQETLTAMSARTMAAPALRVESDEQSDILKVWDTLKTTMFAPDHEEKLARFASDKVGFEKELLKEWALQAKPENVKKVLKEAMLGKAFEDCRPWEYDIMLKSDAKPPLTSKPLREVIPPQLIVMQDKYVSALYSSLFRLMARRLISLLKPEIMLNLLKDLDGIRDHIAANHAWGECLKFLENDFSKFDKSQDRFSYMIMAFIMRKLGFDDELLDRWCDSNARCTLRSLSLGIIMVSQYQNKSGGPATAIMNLVSNMCAVSVCYAGTVVVWAVFMGDDSLVACRSVCASDSSLQRMAEMFNFEAKFYVLEYPYFTSSFVLFNTEEEKVFMVPDPIKRIQKYSVSVNAVNPQWEDKARSAGDTLVAYRHAGDLGGLIEGVTERYGTAGLDLPTLFDALATVSSSTERFRAMYERDPTVIVL